MTILIFASIVLMSELGVIAPLIPALIYVVLPIGYMCVFCCCAGVLFSSWNSRVYSCVGMTAAIISVFLALGILIQADAFLTTPDGEESGDIMIIVFILISCVVPFLWYQASMSLRCQTSCYRPYVDRKWLQLTQKPLEELAASDSDALWDELKAKPGLLETLKGAWYVSDDALAQIHRLMFPSVKARLGKFKEKGMDEINRDESEQAMQEFAKKWLGLESVIIGDRGATWDWEANKNDLKELQEASTKFEEQIGNELKEKFDNRPPEWAELTQIKDMNKNITQACVLQPGALAWTTKSNVVSLHSKEVLTRGMISLAQQLKPAYEDAIKATIGHLGDVDMGAVKTYRRLQHKLAEYDEENEGDKERFAVLKTSLKKKLGGILGLDMLHRPGPLTVSWMLYPLLFLIFSLIISLAVTPVDPEDDNAMIIFVISMVIYASVIIGGLKLGVRRAEVGFMKQYLVADYLRCAVIFKSPEDMVRAVKKIKDVFDVVKIKNGYTDDQEVPASGYRDLKMIVNVPFKDVDLGRTWWSPFPPKSYSGNVNMLCEIQFVHIWWNECKKSTSIWYKIRRAQSYEDLLQDFQKYIVNDEDAYKNEKNTFESSEKQVADINKEDDKLRTRCCGFFEKPIPSVASEIEMNSKITISAQSIEAGETVSVVVD